ncbi:hypothetical protein RRG08_061138 [Elysia crispata]|uniref:Uncharacterized protein n=1 Tax=Elysia crispata TaxID=231223 RepID=A0AAE0XDQ8_9GAST|nr:hypothetical protein RRG08_061138 [Elysia crispata]
MGNDRKKKIPTASRKLNNSGNKEKTVLETGVSPSHMVRSLAPLTSLFCQHGGADKMRLHTYIQAWSASLCRPTGAARPRLSERPLRLRADSLARGHQRFDSVRCTALGKLRARNLSLS